MTKTNELRTLFQNKNPNSKLYIYLPILIQNSQIRSSLIKKLKIKIPYIIPSNCLNPDLRIQNLKSLPQFNLSFSNNIHGYELLSLSLIDLSKNK